MMITMMLALPSMRVLRLLWVLVAWVRTIHKIFNSGYACQINIHIIKNASSLCLLLTCCSFVCVSIGGSQRLLLG
jgi:hypothetical protein